MEAVSPAGKHLLVSRDREKPSLEGWGVQHSLPLLPLLLGERPESSSGLYLAKDDLPGAPPTNTQLLCVGKPQPSPSEVVGWKAEAPGLGVAGMGSWCQQRHQPPTAELRLKRTHGHQEGPATSLRYSLGIFPGLGIHGCSESRSHFWRTEQVAPN